MAGLKIATLLCSSYFKHPHVHYGIRDINFVTFPVCEGLDGLREQTKNLHTVQSASVPTVHVPDK